MAEALLDLPAAEVDALFEVGDRGRRAILQSGEAGAHARHLALCGVTKVDLGEGLVFVGPESEDPAARAELASIERREQRRREAQPGYRQRQQEIVAAFDRENFARYKHRGSTPAVLALHLRLRSRALAAAVQRLRSRPRSRRRRVARRPGGRRAAARAGAGDGPGEPDPREGGTR